VRRSGPTSLRHSRHGWSGRSRAKNAAYDAGWLLCAEALQGALLNGFVSKWLLYNAALEANQPALTLIAWIGSILTVFSFLKATSGVF